MPLLSYHKKKFSLYFKLKFCIGLYVHVPKRHCNSVASEYEKEKSILTRQAAWRLSLPKSC